MKTVWRMKLFFLNVSGNVLERKPLQTPLDVSQLRISAANK